MKARWTVEYSLEVSGHLDTQATLPSKKESPVPIEQETERVSGTVLTFRRRTPLLPRSGIEPRMFDFLSRSQVSLVLLIVELSRSQLTFTTFRRTSLGEWSARRTDFCLTTHNTRKRHISVPPWGYEPAILASERPQTCALDRAATGISWHAQFCRMILKCILIGYYGIIK
jgi:hypothetical protein